MNKYLIIIVLIIILLFIVYNTNTNKEIENFQATQFPIDVKGITELVEKGTDGKAGMQGIQGPRGPRGYPGKDATSDIGKVIKRKDKNIGIGTNEPENNLELHGFMNMVGLEGTDNLSNHTYTSYYPASKSNPRYASVGFLEKDSKDFAIFNENEKGNTILKNKKGSLSLNTNGDIDVSNNLSVSNNLKVNKNLKVVNNLKVDKNLGVKTDNPTAPLHIKGNGGTINLEGVDHNYIQFYPEGIKKGRKGWIGYGDKGDTNLSLHNDNKGGNIVLGYDNKVGVGTNKPKSKLHVDKGAVIITDGHKPAVEGNTQFYTGQKGHYVFRKLGPNHTLKHDGSNDLMTINAGGHTHVKNTFHAVTFWRNS